MSSTAGDVKSVPPATDPAEDLETKHTLRAVPVGLDPKLTGGVTYGRPNPGPAALVRSEEELKTIRYIVLREESVRKIRNHVRRVEKRFEVTHELMDLLAASRNIAAKACDCIADWKRQFAVHRPFVWNGVNYLLTVSASLDFLDRMTKLIKWFGFHLTRNPFLVPSKGVSEGMLPRRSLKHVRKADMVLVREMEKMIVEEERIHGIQSTDDACSWCSVQTTRKTRGMCKKCREFYCWPCVEANLHGDEVAAAKKSTKWICFVCTWDQRQAAVDEGLKEMRRQAKRDYQKAKMAEAAAAQLAERGQFDALDAILRPAPPVKTKRKIPLKKPVEDDLQNSVPILLLPNANPREFMRAFRIKEPLKKEHSKRLRSIALRLYRPTTVWWAYMDNAVGRGPDGGYVTPRPKTPPEVVARREAIAKEKALQKLLVQLAAAKKGPREHWQVRLLRTLPPDRSADFKYGKGTTWQEERERRIRERKVQLTLFLEDRSPRLLLKDKYYPPEDMLPPPPPREKHYFTLNLVRRMGLQAMRVLLKIKYVEAVNDLPKREDDTDEVSIWAHDAGSAGPNKPPRNAKAQMAAAEEDFDDSDDYDSDTGFGEVDYDCEQVMLDVLDKVVPMSDSVKCALDGVEAILEGFSRAWYPEESWRVAADIVNDLVDKATAGYYRGSGAVWEISAVNPRTSTKWKIKVPAVVVKTEADWRYKRDRITPGWQDNIHELKSQVEADNARRRIAEARAERLRLAAVNPYGVSDDEGDGADDDDDDGFEAREDMIESKRFVLEVLDDVIDAADALAVARYEGRIVAEDLARQAEVILERIKLVPVRWPFSKRGPMELRMGPTKDEERVMLAKWEAPLAAAERELMHKAELFDIAYAADLAEEERRRVENEELMAKAEAEMREYLRRVELERWKKENPLLFHESMITAERTEHTDMVELNLFQAQAITGSFTGEEHRKAVKKQAHSFNIRLPKALRPLLRTTLTPSAQRRMARGRSEGEPAFLSELERIKKEEEAKAERAARKAKSKSMRALRRKKK